MANTKEKLETLDCPVIEGGVITQRPNTFSTKGGFWDDCNQAVYDLSTPYLDRDEHKATINGKTYLECRIITDQYCKKRSVRE
ncbi:MAG: hypothetical protein Q7S33_04720 [Nanoarchaeota archaeon]|nr:hypothetical protein [Nanoarchaeota archaeon]